MPAFVCTRNKKQKNSKFGSDRTMNGKSVSVAWGVWVHFKALGKEF